MKFYFSLLFLIFSSTFIFAQEKWDYWTSFEGNFKVFVPNEMQVQTQTITTEIGDLEYYRFFSQYTEEEGRNFVFMVNYVDYPEGSLHSDSTELIHALFEATKEEAIQNVEGELQYSNLVTLADYPGQIWRIDYNEGTAILKTKAFVVRNRFYLLQVAASKAYRMDKMLNQFLDSFRLLSE